MKKYVTFTSLLAVLGFVFLMLWFTPAIQFQSGDTGATYKQLLNFFQSAFGTTIAMPGADPVPHSLVCGGLIVAFIFMIFGIILNFISNKNKLFNLLAGGFYIASGALVLCAVAMVTYVNKNVEGGIGTLGKFVSYEGFIIAVGTLTIILGAFSLINGITGFVKPKAPEVY
ncbi:MAG: hypothetical protein MJ206_00550 [Bacilli bacterium]|nr:hypothetical protein [Bacilli bacterium]